MTDKCERCGSWAAHCPMMNPEPLCADCRTRKSIIENSTGLPIVRVIDTLFSHGYCSKSHEIRDGKILSGSILDLPDEELKELEQEIKQA